MNQRADLSTVEPEPLQDLVEAFEHYDSLARQKGLYPTSETALELGGSRGLAAAEVAAILVGDGFLASARGSVVVDNRTNTLIIRDVVDRVEGILRLIDSIDLPTPQVVIEGRIVETTRQFSRALVQVERRQMGDLTVCSQFEVLHKPDTCVCG